MSLRSPGSVQARGAAYIATLAGINFVFVRDLFHTDFTNNMQTNAGAFMAISRFLLRYCRTWRGRIEHTRRSTYRNST